MGVPRMQGTLFTPLDKSNTSNQSLNVQLRKRLDLHVNLVHGFSIPGLKLRHDNLDIVVIRYVCTRCTLSSDLPDYLLQDIQTCFQICSA